MRKRKSINYNKSKRQFNRSSGSNPRNFSPPPMRGGIRL